VKQLTYLGYPIASTRSFISRFPADSNLLSRQIPIFPQLECAKTGLIREARWLHQYKGSVGIFAPNPKIVAVTATAPYLVSY
jgi:hypothetical protein